MSMIYFAICTLFLISTISALSAPAVIYSAVIHNVQNSPIQCTVIWSKASGLTFENSLFTVESNNYYLTNEKQFSIESYKGHVPIEEIRCGKFVVTAPFDKVNSPEKNWEFLVQSDGMISVGPSPLGDPEQ